MTDAERVRAIFRRSVETLGRLACPDCGGTTFRRGPRGGLAVNVRCASCGHHFNVGPGGWFAERIHCDTTCCLVATR